MLDVGHDDAQQIVHLPAHAVQLDHLRKILQRGVKAVEPVLRMVTGGDRDEHRHPGIDLLGVYDRHPALDHAELFELLDAAPARGGGKPDLLADFGHRERAVPLEDVEDLTVHSVEHGVTGNGFAPNEDHREWNFPSL
jgi:hypothetical protein